MRSVLILTAAFGEGHNAAARNIRTALSAADPSLQVELMDIFQLAHRGMNRIFQRGYLLIINHLPGVWSWVFKQLDKSSIVAKRIGIFRGAAGLLEKTVREMEPAVIVITFPAYNHLLDHLRGTTTLKPFRQVTVVTDSVTINSVWYRCHSDFFYVPNEDTATVLRAACVAEERIVVTGFPTPAVFASMQTAKQPPAPGEKWKVLLMMNSGRRAATATVEELLGIEQIELTVTVGRDANLEREVRAIANRCGKQLQVYGWTPEIPRLMMETHLLISKAGGATVQESLAAGTPMIVSQVVPGQEEGNARLLEKNGAGVVAETPEAIAGAVRDAFADGGERWLKMYGAARKLGRPDAAEQIAARVLGLIHHEGREGHEGN